VESTWQSILAGQSALQPLTQWDLSSWPCHLGGEIKLELAKMLPDRKLLKVISRQDVLGINAAMQAVEHSQLLPYRETLSTQDDFNDKTAVYVGSPGNKYCQQYDFLPLLAKTKGDMAAFAQQLFTEVHPMWLLRILPNNVLAYTGITYGFKGPNQNVTNHAVGGTQALLEAYHAISSGHAERAIVVAYDTAIEPQALYYYEKLGVISPQHLKPFDKSHDGTLLAEGAAALVLESEASAKARGATVYAELAGGFSASEAAGLFNIEEDGQALSQLMARLLEACHLEPQAVDLVVAHGNGNRKSDVSEALAIQRVFTSSSVPVTAFKWAMGHTICASGVLDVVLASCALNDKCIPGIAKLEQLAPACEALNAQQTSRYVAQGLEHALIINRGYASMNAAVVIKACHDSA
jgi:3-oxoacyl-[acyl-carrier-protein] synthase-1